MATFQNIFTKEWPRGVYCLPDGGFLGESGRDTVGYFGFGPLLECEVDGGLTLARRVLGHRTVAPSVCRLHTGDLQPLETKEFKS